MRTLIFGCKGQLGRELLSVFSQAGEVRGHDLPEVDITDETQAFSVAEDFGPELIINAAAYTDVEGAEDHLTEAMRINETGARNLAEIAARLRAPIVYYSTDFIFDGRATAPYKTDAIPAPLSVYGKSKLAGEQATRRANPQHFIVRTAWLYGPGGNNFVEKMLALGNSRPKLRVVTDEIGSPTHSLDLAEATLALARSKHYGVFHAVNEGAVSRYDFARRIFDLAEVSTPIEPCLGAEYPSKARRPAYGALDCTSLRDATGHTMRPWQDALMDYMHRRTN